MLPTEAGAFPPDGEAWKFAHFYKPFVLSLNFPCFLFLYLHWLQWYLPLSFFSHVPVHFALAGEVGFEPCYAEVLRVVQGKLHQPDEIQRSSFYAFSYYYDRAVDTHMIGKFTPGVRSGRTLGKALVGKGEELSEMFGQR